MEKTFRKITTNMALGKSIKLYLTIFVATTCMYMVLYQYHISRQPMPQAEIIKHSDKSIDKDSPNGIGGSYTSYSLFSNNITTSSASVSSSPLTSSLNSTSVNAVKLSASNKTATSSTSLSALSLLSLPSHTTKLFKKMNLFLWSPMSLLPSSSSKRAISKKSSLALQQLSQPKQTISTRHSSSSSSPSSSSSSSRLMDLNNTLITSSTSSSTVTISTTTTTKTSTPFSTVAASSSSRFTTTIKASTELSPKTKQFHKINSDKLSQQQLPDLDQEQQQLQHQTYKAN